MIIGLTGGIGSGKSAAADYFIDLGVDVIDADMAARNALQKNSKGYDLFIKKFVNIKKYLNLGLRKFASDVRLKKYPKKKHSY